MVACNPKGGRTAAPAFPAMLLLMMLIMMLLDAYCCSAAIVAKSNTSFRCSGGRLDECLIEEDLELELGFLMNPYVSRILAEGSSSGPNTANPNDPAFTCGKPQDVTKNPSYAKCISDLVKKNKHKCEHKNVYGRCLP